MLMTSVGESECLLTGIPGRLNQGHWARGSRYTHLGKTNPSDPGLWARRHTGWVAQPSPQGSLGWDFSWVGGSWGHLQACVKPAPSGLSLGGGKAM